MSILAALPHHRDNAFLFMLFTFRSIVWKILPSQTSVETGMLALLKALRDRSVQLTVVVLADRGLYAKWLFEAINGLGGHPMLRFTIGFSFRPEGCYHWVPFRQWVAPSTSTGKAEEPPLRRPRPCLIVPC